MVDHIAKRHGLLRRDTEQDEIQESTRKREKEEQELLREFEEWAAELRSEVTCLFEGLYV